MTTNTVPSLGVKGNGKTLGLTNGSANYGLTANNTSVNTGYTGVYGSNYGTANSGSAYNHAWSLGITTDINNSGIITNTGTMSAVSSRAIIKY